MQRWKQRPEWYSHKPANARSSQMLLEAWKDSPLEPLQGAQPCQHFDFRLQEPRPARITFCCFKPPLSVLLCSGSPGQATAHQPLLERSPHATLLLGRSSDEYLQETKNIKILRRACAAGLCQCSDCEAFIPSSQRTLTSFGKLLLLYGIQAMQEVT